MVPGMWRQVFAQHDDEAVFAELSEEPGGDSHVITVGVLAEQPNGGGDSAPAGRWLHHEHRGPLTSIGSSYGEMFTYAAENGLRLGTLKLDEGYRALQRRAASCRSALWECVPWPRDRLHC